MRLFTLVLLAFLPHAAFADSLWDHNGSVMRLVAEGAQRYFYYENPRPGMREAGVREGTLLFDGFRDGDRYAGTARVFSAFCAEPMSYWMEGRVLSETYVVLEGQRPNFTNCRPNGTYRWERLEFRYLRSADGGIISGPGAPALANAAAAVERAVDILLGDPYGRTRDQTRSYITGVWQGGGGGSICDAPGLWMVEVAAPPLPGNFDPIRGVLALDAATGALNCTTLPLLD